MSDQAGTSERVYLSIKRHLAMSGPRPGERLDVTSLSHRFSASATPVRSALFRLVGERLVTIIPGQGFHAPRLSEPALADLYDWNGTVLIGALRLAPADERNAPPAALRAAAIMDHEDVVARTENLFSAIAEVAGNGEYRAAIASANDRLHRVRRAEGALVADQAKELADLAGEFSRGDIARLRQGLLAYHRRRQRLLSALVRTLHGLDERDP
jgi:DNA-binding GntR family transcriptional regulator